MQIPWCCLQCCVNSPIGNNVFHILQVAFASTSASCVNGALVYSSLDSRYLQSGCWKPLCGDPFRFWVVPVRPGCGWCFCFWACYSFPMFCQDSVLVFGLCVWGGALACLFSRCRVIWNCEFWGCIPKTHRIFANFHLFLNLLLGWSGRFANFFNVTVFVFGNTFPKLTFPNVAKHQEFIALRLIHTKHQRQCNIGPA